MPAFPGPFGTCFAEVLRVLPVDDGAEHRLRRRERLALDRVPLVRDDVPRHRHGRDPVLADDRAARAAPPAATDVIAPARATTTAPARAASASARGPPRAPVTPERASPDHGVTTTVPPMSGPWIQQKYLYVPGCRERHPRRPRQRRSAHPAVSGVRRSRCRGRRPRRRCSGFGSDAEREERRHLVRARSGPSGTGRSSCPSARCTSSGRTTMLCTSLGDLLTKLTVVPGLDPQHLREEREQRRLAADAHGRPCSARELGRREQRLRLRPAGRLLQQRLRLDLVGRLRHGRARRLDDDGRLHARVERADELVAARLREACTSPSPAAPSAPAGDSAPLEAGVFPEIVFGPNGPNAGRVVDELRAPVEVERLAGRVDDALVRALRRIGHEQRDRPAACT